VHVCARASTGLRYYCRRLSPRGPAFGCLLEGSLLCEVGRLARLVGNLAADDSPAPQRSLRAKGARAALEWLRAPLLAGMKVPPPRSEEAEAARRAEETAAARSVCPVRACAGAGAPGGMLAWGVGQARSDRAAAGGGLFEGCGVLARGARWLPRAAAACTDGSNIGARSSGRDRARGGGLGARLDRACLNWRAHAQLNSTRARAGLFRFYLFLSQLEALNSSHARSLLSRVRPLHGAAETDAQQVCDRASWGLQLCVAAAVMSKQATQHARLSSRRVSV
jgi:hypothetical protein